MPFSPSLRRRSGSRPVWRGLLLALLWVAPGASASDPAAPGASASDPAAPGASASDPAALAAGPAPEHPASAWIGGFCPPRADPGSGAVGFAAAAAAAAILSRRRDRPAGRRGGALP